MKLYLGTKLVNIYMNNKNIDINPKIESTELEGLVFRSTTIGMDSIENEELKTLIENESSWTVVSEIKVVNNTYTKLIESTGFNIEISYSRNTGIITLMETSDGINYKKNINNVRASTDVMGDSNKFTAAASYDSELKKFKLYINNNLICSSIIKEGYTLQPVTSVKIGGVQASCLDYRIYNRLLTDDELTKLHNELYDGAIYLSIGDTTEYTINEGETVEIPLTIIGNIDGDSTVTINTNNWNVYKQFKNITFNKDMKSIIMTAKTYVDDESGVDKTPVIMTISSDNYDFLPKKLTINVKNTTENKHSEIEAKAKIDYPDKCLNFKGSFDWNETASSTFYDDLVYGDFWINDTRSSIGVFNTRLHFPNNLIYYDGNYIQPLYYKRYGNTSAPTHYDVCIVGGGAGGVSTAYALKDQGLKVCLIEKLDELGGTHIHASIASLIATPTTAMWIKPILEEGYNMGIVSTSKYADTVGRGEGTKFERLWRSSQFCRGNTLNKKGTQFELPLHFFYNRYYQDLKDNIDIRLRTEFIESVIENNKITQIKVKSLDADSEYYITADYFVDCSADGVLCRSGKTLGTDFYIGTDGRARFNEKAYSSEAEPDIYGINVVEAGYVKCNLNRNDKIQDATPTGTYDDIFPGGNGTVTDLQSSFMSLSTTSKNQVPPKIFIDYGNDYALAYAEDRCKYHSSVNYHVGYYCQQNKMLGIRESYRIKCDYMCTQTDCEHRVVRDDIVPNHIIALSTWYTDLHNAAVHVSNSGFNGIPYESLIPSAFKNVLVASRCFGCSHIAQASFRLTRTMMSLGTAAGNALIQCVNNNIEDVRNIDIQKLQQDIGIFELFDEVDSLFILPTTNISLDRTSLIFTTTDTQTLTSTKIPENSDQEVTWSSDNNEIATVSNGIVTPIANGECIITATSGNCSATCKVTVNLNN